MPYNQRLADRLRQKLIPIVQADEKKMFGGVAFLVDGNMTVGVIKESIIVRVGPEKHETSLKKPGVSPFKMTGKPMSGWVMVSQEGCSTDKVLENWIHIALEFVKTLPPK